MASVNVLRGNLYLLARLPDKKEPSHWRQQRVPLKLADTPANQRTARKRLAELEKQLARGSFDWDYWVDTGANGITWRAAIHLLYQKKVVLGRTSESTWNINYMGRLRQVNQNSECTTSSMKRALMKYERDSCSYKELYYLLKHISGLTKVPMPEVPLPTYGRAEVVEVPSDEEIVEWVMSAEEPARWYFGMMATYGLRPHEIEHSTVNEDGFCEVRKGKKTSGNPGSRIVPPLEPEWVELFSLCNPRFRSMRGSESGRNDQVSKFLYKEKVKLGIVWRPYSLRHAYAGRMWRRGGAKLDIYAAAETMGHSIKEHVETYRGHVSKSQIAKFTCQSFGDDFLERARQAVQNGKQSGRAA
jgi:integrase